ncbi:MAG: hypothetical protein AAFN38_01450 [Cyanobacteria bacterium J06560_5]
MSRYLADSDQTQFGKNLADITAQQPETPLQKSAVPFSRGRRFLWFQVDGGRLRDDFGSTTLIALSPVQ